MINVTALMAAECGGGNSSTQNTACVGARTSIRCRGVVLFALLWEVCMGLRLVHAATLTTTLIAFLPLAVTLSAQSKKEISRAAELALNNNNYLEARRLAIQCLDLEPNDKRCNDLRARANRLLAQAWKNELANAHELNVSKRIQVHLQLQNFEPTPENENALARARAKRDELDAEAQAFVAALHDGQTLPFPTSLSPYIPFVASVAEASKEYEVHTALRQSADAKAAGNLDRAISLLIPVRAHREVQAQAEAMEREVREAPIRALEADLEKEPLTFNALVPLAERYRDLVSKGLLSQSDALTARVRKSIYDTVASNLAWRATDVANADLPAVARVVRERVPKGLPDEIVPWQELVGAPPAVQVSTSVTGDRIGCPQATAEALADSVAHRLSTRFLPTSGVPLKVSLSDVSCTFDSGVVREDTLNSTYVASQQQLTNPDYIRLQQELAAAQARLAQQRVQNANTGTGGSPWAAALQGAAEGLAASTVTKLQNQLAQTPPFIYQPVILSYSPVRSVHAKKATATLTVAVEDASTGLANVETVSAEAVATADGLRGVLPGDQQGLRNQEPSLTSDATLGGDALNAALDKISAPISKFTASALLMRAERAFKANNIAVALGNALLAKDLGATSDDLGMFGDPLRELAITPLDRVNTIRFAGMPVDAKPRPVRPAVARPLAKGGSSRTLGRPAVIEAALGSVVTIKTGEATGSGFFVGTSGLMITNAHVVQGASKIIVRTRNQETFLASVVKLSAADDLALLRVQGLEVEGLPLGSLQAVEVGQDVIAIGSPLGLAGC